MYAFLLWFFLAPFGFTGSAELQNCRPCPNGEEACARAAADAANVTGEEALARLIFAESLSTGFWRNRCNAPGGENQIFESIAWGVMNRVGSPPAVGSKIKDIVFARSQFRTSFSSARQNPFAAAFLCPQRAQTYLSGVERPANAGSLYRSAEEIARRVLTEFNAGRMPTNRQNISNFFYPRSEHFGEMRPTWAANANPTQNRGYFPILGNDNPCVEFYCLTRACSGNATGTSAPRPAASQATTPPAGAAPADPAR